GDSPTQNPVTAKAQRRTVERMMGTTYCRNRRIDRDWEFAIHHSLFSMILPSFATFAPLR
ncbi:MAG TPA: hypothetical protein VEW72_02825, partial [Burkholderiales bacterium]|nr:hypothetical protein [Burkholderiales bacterium]